LKAWGCDARDTATFLALLGGPWCLKPLYGLLSDFVPLAGYRRKSYLAVAAVAATLCFLGLYVLPLSPGARNVLFAALFLPTLAITVSDVVLDALLIETGQSLSITGRLQSVCAGAGYAATLLTGVWGGALSEEHHQQLGFLACGLLMGVTLLLTIFYVREPRAEKRPTTGPSARQTLVAAFRSPGLWAVSSFLFAWHFNPFSQSVLYSYMTGPLEMSEKAYGHTVSLMAVGAIAACVTYGLYCRRLPMAWLLPGSIVWGVASTLTYWPLVQGNNAAWISLFAGFSYMTGSMITLDLAARACPLQAAGTVFALLMAVCNLSTSLSTWVGGYCYEECIQACGASGGLAILLVTSAAFTLCSWFAVRRLPRELLV
jgi:MFS family permease